MLRPCAHDGPLDRIAPLGASHGPLAARIAQANEAARSFARKRLTRHFPDAAIRALDSYFPEPSVHGAESGAAAYRPRLSDLLDAICLRTHDFRIGEKARGMQIGVLPGAAPIDIDMLGDRVEPDSSLCHPLPEGLAAAAAANASIEIRVFDRHFEAWAEVADDIAAVSGADIFMKLFIAGGARSVNDWHRDTSDVVVTMLDGRKRFQVGTADSADDSPEDEINALLEPGDVLLLPRGRLHNATPAGEVSALLSIGLMRMADWSYRSVSPSHLNLVNPRSPALYRLSLRPHAPPTRGQPGLRDRLRTRLPGGIGLVSEAESETTLLAGGRLWQADPAALDQLLRIHEAEDVTAGQLTGGNGSDAGLETLGGLIAAGLVRRQ